MKEIDIYTDCSSRDCENYGISVFIIEDEVQKALMYKTNLQELIKEFNVLFDGKNYKSKSITIFECYAIFKALQWLNFQTLNYNKIRIYTDNESVFLRLNNCKCKSRNILDKILTDHCLSIINSNVDVRLIKAHCGVYGNEIADYIAKSALRKTENVLIKTEQRNGILSKKSLQKAIYAKMRKYKIK